MRLKQDSKHNYPCNAYKSNFQSHSLSIEPVHEISNNVVCATSKASDQPAHTRSRIRAFACGLYMYLQYNKTSIYSTIITLMENKSTSDHRSLSQTYVGPDKHILA